MEWRAFDAIYLINLPERADRKRELERELRSVGLQADDPRLVWIRAVRPLEAGEFPSIGARGCFLSHLTCLQSASERGYGRVLILEDDACFPRFRVSGLKSVVGRLNGLNWAVWYGGGRMLHEFNVGIDNIEIIPIDSTVDVQTSHCIAFQGEAIGSARAFFGTHTDPSGRTSGGWPNACRWCLQYVAGPKSDCYYSCHCTAGMRSEVFAVGYRDNTLVR